MSTTTNYGWTKPTVAGDTDAWGSELNADLDSIDTTVKAVSDVANAALPKAGGAMSGRADLFTATAKHVDLGTTNAAALDLSTANSLPSRRPQPTRRSCRTCPRRPTQSCRSCSR